MGVVDFLRGLFGCKQEPARAIDDGQSKAPQAVQDFYLTPRNIRDIRDLRPTYEWACRKVGMWPWEALAATHYRESEFKRKGEEPHAGPFAIDPPGAGIQADMIRAHVEHICSLYAEPYADLDDSITLACLVAAHKLSHDAQDALPGMRCDDERYIAAGMWHYNGTSRHHVPPGVKSDEANEWVNRSWAWSPYVSNDPKHGKQLRMRGTLPDANGDGKDEVIDRLDPRPGALVVYREILQRKSELV